MSSKAAGCYGIPTHSTSQEGRLQRTRFLREHDCKGSSSAHRWQSVKTWDLLSCIRSRATTIGTFPQDIFTVKLSLLLHVDVHILNENRVFFSNPPPQKKKKKKDTRLYKCFPSKTIWLSSIEFEFLLSPNQQWRLVFFCSWLQLDNFHSLRTYSKSPQQPDMNMRQSEASEEHLLWLVDCYKVVFENVSVNIILWQLPPFSISLPKLSFRCIP